VRKLKEDAGESIKFTVNTKAVCKPVLIALSVGVYTLNYNHRPTEYMWGKK
jgi:hypothetical protein